MPVPDLGRARESPSLFRPLKRGDGRAEQARKKKKPAPVGAPRDIFPLSRFTVPGPGRPGSSRRGCSGVRPGVQLRTTPAGAASRPAITTPHESAPQRTGQTEYNRNIESCKEFLPNVKAVNLRCRCEI